MSGHQGPNTWFPALRPPPTPEQRARSSHHPPRFFPTTPQSLGQQESLVCASPLNPAPQPVITQQGHWGTPARIHTRSSRSVLILQPERGAGGQGDAVTTTQMKSDHLREMRERKPKFCSQKKVTGGPGAWSGDNEHKHVLWGKSRQGESAWQLRSNMSDPRVYEVTLPAVSHQIQYRAKVVLWHSKLQLPCLKSASTDPCDPAGPQVPWASTGHLSTRTSSPPSSTPTGLAQQVLSSIKILLAKNLTFQIARYKLLYSDIKFYQKHFQNQLYGRFQVLTRGFNYSQHLPQHPSSGIHTEYKWGQDVLPMKGLCSDCYSRSM